MFKLTTTVLGLALVRLSRAVGSISIKNQCDFPVNLWSVSDQQGPMVTLSSNGGEYSETYRTNPNGGGISIKITPEDYVTDPVTQLEYTLTDLIWYDVSNINGMPFQNYGITLIPSDSSCDSVLCDSTVDGGLCSSSVFLQPDDNFAIHACQANANLAFSLCTDRNPPASSPSATSQAPSPPPATSSAPPPVPSSTEVASNPETIPGTFVTYGVTVTQTTFVTHYVTVENTVIKDVPAPSYYRHVRRI